MKTKWMVMALLLAVGTLTAQAQVLVNDTFEGDSVNPSPRTALGADPAGWTFGGQLANGNGVVDASVEAVGSPSGGSKSMLLFDNNQTDPRMEANRYFTSQPDFTTRIAFDLRVNDVLNPSADLLYVRMLTTGGGAGYNGLSLTGNGSQSSLNLNNMVGGGLVQTLTTGNWYRITMTGTNLMTAPTTWDLSVYDYQTALTNNYTLSRGGTSAGGYFRWLFNSGPNANATGDVSIDNFTVTAVPEPSALAMLLIATAAWIWRRRRV